jgi:demethylmenaquinone methyltransferase/2-methoxy-6-polyprenyl-1,4-benzoquinol methylase
MVKPSQTSSESKAVQVRRMFSRIVPRYDLMNTVMTGGMDRSWRRTATRLAQPAGGLALDVGAGTGEFTFELVRQGARLAIGLDFVREMLTVAQAKAARAQLDGPVAFMTGDALRLPFPDATFDCLVNGFVLRNVADLPAALREMQRVLKPGGRLVCLEITHPPAFFAPFFRPYFNGVVPLLGALITGEATAYRYLPRSLGPFPQADRLAGMLRDAGFTNVAYRRLGFGTVAVHRGYKAS